jgi:hypothetical protein
VIVEAVSLFLPFPVMANGSAIAAYVETYRHLNAVALPSECHLFE